MGNCCRPFGENRVSERRKKRIVLLLVGLDNAGKTSAAKNLLGEPVEGVVPTVGFSAVNLSYRGYSVTIYDLGGGPQIRGIWHRYFVDVHGIIFVLDASDVPRLDETRLVLRELLTNEKLAGKPVLLLANKQDRDGALDELDIVERLDLESLVNQQRCPTMVETCSTAAVPGKRRVDPAIHNGYVWLLNVIVQDYARLDSRVSHDVLEQAKLNEAAREKRRQRVEAMRKQRGVEDTTGEEEEAGDAFDPFKPIGMVAGRGRGEVGGGDRVIRVKPPPGSFVRVNSPAMNDKLRDVNANHNDAVRNSNSARSNAVRNNSAGSNVVHNNHFVGGRRQSPVDPCRVMDDADDVDVICGPPWGKTLPPLIHSDITRSLSGNALPPLVDSNLSCSPLSGKTLPPLVNSDRRVSSISYRPASDEQRRKTSSPGSMTEEVRTSGAFLLEEFCLDSLPSGRRVTGNSWTSDMIQGVNDSTMTDQNGTDTTITSQTDTTVSNQTDSTVTSHTDSTATSQNDSTGTSHTDSTATSQTDSTVTSQNGTDSALTRQNGNESAMRSQSDNDSAFSSPTDVVLIKESGKKTRKATNKMVVSDVLSARDDSMDLVIPSAQVGREGKKAARSVRNGSADRVIPLGQAGRDGKKVARSSRNGSVDLVTPSGREGKKVVRSPWNGSVELEKEAKKAVQSPRNNSVDLISQSGIEGNKAARSVRNSSMDLVSPSGQAQREGKKAVRSVRSETKASNRGAVVLQGSEGTKGSYSDSMREYVKDQLKLDNANMRRKKRMPLRRTNKTAPLPPPSSDSSPLHQSPRGNGDGVSSPRRLLLPPLRIPDLDIPPATDGRPSSEGAWDLDKPLTSPHNPSLPSPLSPSHSSPRSPSLPSPRSPLLSSQVDNVAPWAQIQEQTTS